MDKRITATTELISLNITDMELRILGSQSNLPLSPLEAVLLKERSSLSVNDVSFD